MEDGGLHPPYEGVAVIWGKFFGSFFQERTLLAWVGPCIDLWWRKALRFSALRGFGEHDSLADAVADLGEPLGIWTIFVGFQRFLYQSTA